MIPDFAADFAEALPLWAVWKGDPLADQARPKPPAHELGQDLSALSLAELDERITLLEREIERLREARRGKEASKAAAAAFFKG